MLGSPRGFLNADKTQNVVENERILDNMDNISEIDNVNKHVNHGKRNNAVNESVYFI